MGKCLRTFSWNHMHSLAVLLALLVTEVMQRTPAIAQAPAGQEVEAAPPAPPVPPAPPARDASLEPLKLYFGVNRPIILEARTAAVLPALTIVLLDHDGHVLAEPVEIRTGRFDLSRSMPAVWSLRRAVHLQLLSHGEAVGTPLVLEPMLTRVVPMTERVTRPDGVKQVRIIGWRSELATADEVVLGEEAREETGEAAGGEESSSPIADEAPAWMQRTFTDAHQPRVFTGLRIYREQRIELRTTLGAMTVALRPDEAPNTAWNFMELARGGFYDEVIFHRIVPLDRMGRPFVIQAGDPSETGDGGAGEWLPIEPSELPHDAGVISMARADDPDSAGSQFFICLSREGTARLDGQYCAFGRVIEGDSVIRAIAGVQLADVETGRAENPPIILTARLQNAPPRTPFRPDAARTPDRPREAAPKPGRVPR